MHGLRPAVRARFLGKLADHGTGPILSIAQVSGPDDKTNQDTRE